MRRKIHETNRFTTRYVYVSRQLVHAKCQEICRYSQVENAYARARPVKKPVSTRARPSFTVTQSWSWLETKNSEGILRQEDAPSSYEFYFEIINIGKENDDVETKRGKQKSVRRFQVQKCQSLFVLVEKIISHEEENVEIAFQLLR